MKEWDNWIGFVKWNLSEKREEMKFLISKPPLPTLLIVIKFFFSADKPHIFDNISLFDCMWCRKLSLKIYFQLKCKYFLSEKWRELKTIEFFCLRNKKWWFHCKGSERHEMRNSINNFQLISINFWAI